MSQNKSLPMWMPTGNGGMLRILAHNKKVLPPPHWSPTGKSGTWNWDKEGNKGEGSWGWTDDPSDPLQNDGPSMLGKHKKWFVGDSSLAKKWFPKPDIKHRQEQKSLWKKFLTFFKKGDTVKK